MVQNDNMPVSYKGNRPYIFISYAHADSDKVFPIITRLQEDGFRVWYDEGIDPGTEWEDFIATAIDKCGYFFAFISKNYLLSDFCKDEMSYVRDLKPPKKRLLLYLENVALNKGMKLRQSRLQAIHTYRYTSQEKLYEQIYNTEDLSKCHNIGSIPALSLLSKDNPYQKNSLYSPRAAKSKPKSAEGKGYSKKATIIVVCVVLALLFLRSLAGKWLLSVFRDKVESGEMTEENEDDSFMDKLIPKDSVELTSIESPVESDGFQIREDVLNTMGTTFDKAVCVNGVDAAYVSYNVGDFNYFSGVYSVDSSWAISDNEYSLLVYLDGNEDEPCINVKMSRSTVETPLDIDVSDAQFITFKLEGYHCSLLLTDCYLSTEAISPVSEEHDVSESGNKSNLKLVSIESPVEADGFQICENVLNTMGTTYDKAVVINGVDSAYVRYNVQDYSYFTGTYSVDSSWAISDNEYSLLIYLDGNVDEPYANLTLNRSTVETPLDIDVSSSQFITFKLEGYHCSLVLADCLMSNEAVSLASEKVQSTGIPISGNSNKTKLISIESPVEADGFQIREDVLNTMGTTYDKAVVVDGVDSAYVRYNVGDYSRFTGTYSVDSSWAISDNEYSLLIYLDGNVDEPYANLKLNRSTVETPLDIDVSSSQFITFKLEGYHCSLVLSDCYLIP